MQRTNVIKIFMGIFLTLSLSSAQRLIYDADGNYHDKDDICASPVSIALIAKNGLQNKLSVYVHSNHIWNNSSNQEKNMITSVEQTMVKWGGFNNTKVFNGYRQSTQAIAAVTAEINKSTESDPLLIIAAGPMEIIGRAIKNSKTAPRKYVRVVSHSNWNNVHAQKDHKGYSFSALGKMGVKLVQIKDQNPGTNRAYSEYYWMRDSKDSKIKWLWDRGQAAGKSKYDPSDCGMTYWAITGGFTNGNGDQNCNPTKLKNMLTSNSSPAPLPQTTGVIDGVVQNSTTQPKVVMNSSTGSIDLQLNAGHSVQEVMIFDLAGSKIVSQKVSPEARSIEISSKNIKAGKYLLRMKTGTSITTTSIVRPST